MAYFECKKNEIEMYEFIPKTTKPLQVAYIRYKIENNTLTISDIQRLKIADMHFDRASNFFGTDIFNKLLCCLQVHDVKITKIEGRLAAADRENNWAKSISFYDSFVRHLEPYLNYSLIFDLYENTDFTSKYFLSSDKAIREKEIATFIEQHIATNSEASFTYYVVEK